MAHVSLGDRFGNVIVSVTLGSGCEINFSSLKSKAHVAFYLESGSLFVIQDEARYGWKHGILPRKSDEFAGQILPRGRRVSLTFRTVVIQAV